MRSLGSVYANIKAKRIGQLWRPRLPSVLFWSELPIWIGPGIGRRLREIIYRDHGDALRTVRILRFYEGNTIIMVKPDRLRYWIPSTAIRDADETLVDLQRQGY